MENMLPSRYSQKPSSSDSLGNEGPNYNLYSRRRSTGSVSRTQFQEGGGLMQLSKNRSLRSIDEDDTLLEQNIKTSHFETTGKKQECADRLTLNLE